MNAPTAMASRTRTERGLDRAVRAAAQARDPRFDERATCGLATSYLFDPKGADELLDTYRGRLRRARYVCHGCPVRKACLQWATKKELSGIFAGTPLIDGQPSNDRKASQS